MIRFQGVWKRYGRRVALRELDLELPRAAALLVRGPNGGGKSTCLKLMAGLAVPDRGAITVDSIRVGYLGHWPQLMPALSARENLRYQCALYGVDDAAIGPALARVDADAYADVAVAGLSRGMQQRVALARLLAVDADLWVLDEAETGLDAAGRDCLDALVREARRAGRTVVAATHVDFPALADAPVLELREGRRA